MWVHFLGGNFLNYIVVLLFGQLRPLSPKALRDVLYPSLNRALGDMKAFICYNYIIITI